MSSDLDPISLPEAVVAALDIVESLRLLSVRASDCRLKHMPMVLSLAAESLQDNIEQVAEWSNDD